MNPARPSAPPALRSRGSALLTVILFTTVMALMVASILGWSVTERKLNTRTVYWIEARNAAEALCEYGASQVNTVTSNLTLPPAVEQTFFDPAKSVSSTYNPVQLPVVPGTAYSPFNPNGANGITSESHVDTNPLGTPGPNDPTGIYGMEVIAGPQVPITTPGQKTFIIDPNIPENVNDPYVGLRVLRYDYNILAKATVVPHDSIPPITAYVKQTISVRGAPLFDWAIFYATSDLEIYPGKPMTVTGPVHTNFDMYINSAGTGGFLSFQGPVTTTGHIFHTMENSTDGQVAISNNDINFKGPGGQVSMYQGGGIWYDSTYGNDTGVTGPDTPGNPLYTLANNQTYKTNFTIYAEKTWPSNVLTADMGVPPFNPKGFNKALAAGTDPKGNLFKADTPYVDSGAQIPGPTGSIILDHHIMDYNGTVATGNVSYFNDPPDSDFPTMAATNAYYVARKGLEDVKYANLANLYILVNVNTSALPYTAIVTYYGPYNFNNIGTAGYGPNGGILLGQNQYTATTASGGPLVGSGAGKTGVEPFGLVSFVPYTVDGGGHVLTGLYDQRNSTPVDLVQINVNALNRALMDVNLDPSTNGGPTHPYQGEPGATPPSCLDAILNNQDPNPNGVANPDHGNVLTTNKSTIWGSGSMSFTGTNLILNDNTAGYRDGAATLGGWNGTVYVDVEATPALNPNVANTHEIGVGIGNGQTTLAAGGASIGQNTGTDRDPTTTNLVPNHLNADGTPTANSPFGSVHDAIVGPQTGLNYGAGLTIATNSPVYIVGNFNADGAHITATASTQSDDNAACPSDECPVSIIGDAVTFLSPKYFNSGAAGATFTANPSSAAWFPHFSPGNTLTGTPSLPPPPNGVGSNAYNSKNTMKPISTGDAEVAMAMVSGLVLTNASAASGGVHNLPRYLEDWSTNNNTHVIRGSLVNLYTSKIAIQPYTTAYYVPPNRAWGFANLFSACGILPPSTPLTFSNRRTYFNDLSKDGPAPANPGDQPTSYTKARIDPTWGWPADTFAPLP